MRIVMLTVGTDGDVFPFVTLGKTLKDAGYDVVIAAPENYMTRIGDLGFEVRRCGPNFEKFVKSDIVVSNLNSHSILQGIKYRTFLKHFVKTILNSVVSDTFAHTEDADAIIFHPFIVAAPDIAEARKIPAVMAWVAPLTKTSEYAFPALPVYDLGATLNGWSYRLPDLSIGRKVIDEINRVRGVVLGLGPRKLVPLGHGVDGEELPALYSVSPSLAPNPADWTEKSTNTGYWIEEKQLDWTPPPDLQAFLDAGPPPLYIGFGSMPLRNDKAAILLQALKEEGLRALLSKGWSEIEPKYSGGNIFVIGHAPHSVLFPMTRAIVHHGGSGTTHTGLRAGAATLICPFNVDQYYWAERVHRSGAGPKGLPVGSWTVKRLRGVLRDLYENSEYQIGAQKIAEAMQHEDGLARALAWLRPIVGEPERRIKPLTEKV